MQRPGITRNRESFHSKYYLWKPVKGDFSYTEREVTPEEDCERPSLLLQMFFAQMYNCSKGLKKLRDSPRIGRGDALGLRGVAGPAAWNLRPGLSTRPSRFLQPR